MENRWSPRALWHPTESRPWLEAALGLLLVFLGILARPSVTVVITASKGDVHISGPALEHRILAPDYKPNNVQWSIPRSVIPTSVRSVTCEGLGGGTCSVGAIHRTRGSGKSPVGELRSDYGVAKAERGTVAVNARGPFRLTVVFRGATYEASVLRLDGNVPIEVRFNRGLYRDDSFLTVGGALVAHARPTLLWDESLRSLLGLGCEAMGWALVFAALVGLAGRALVPSRAPEAGSSRSQLYWGTVVVAALAAFGLGVAINRWVHLESAQYSDAVSYLHAAKWLANGQLFGLIPDWWEPEFLVPPWTKRYGDKVVSCYPIGWPMLLAVGEYFRAGWIVEPLLRAMTVVAAAALGRRFFGEVVGAATAALTALSPTLLGVSSGYMAHASTGAAYTVGWALLVAGFEQVSLRRRLLSLAAAGLCFGYLFSVRPYTGLLILPLPALWAAARLFSDRSRVSAIAAASFGFLIGILPVTVYIWTLLGRFTLLPKAACRTPFPAIEWRIGLSLAHHNVNYLAAGLTGWGWSPWGGVPVRWLPGALALLPFFARRVPGIAWAFLAGPLLLAAGHCLFNFDGIEAFGPRYYSEALPTFLVLVALGLVTLWRSALVASARFRWGHLLVHSAFLSYGFLIPISSLPERGARARNRLGVQTSFCDSRPEKDASDTLYVSQDRGTHWWASFTRCFAVGLSNGPRGALITAPSIPPERLRAEKVYLWTTEWSRLR